MDTSTPQIIVVKHHSSPEVTIQDYSSDEDKPSRTHSTPPTKDNQKDHTLSEDSMSEKRDNKAGEDTENTFMSLKRMVTTLQFIKKWAGRAEKKNSKDEFLERFKMSGPNIDDALNGGLPGVVDSYIPVWKRRNIWINPSGSMLYRYFRYTCY